MVNTLFHNTLLNVFTLSYLRPKHFKPSIPDQILCFYVNGLISANKHFSWKSCPKLLRRRSSLHYGYCWFGTAAFCTTYRKHAKFSPGSWKSVCGYTTGLFIMQYSIHLFVNELTLPFHGNLMLIISLLCAMAPCLSMEASCNSIHLFVNELTLHFHGNLHIEQWNQLFVVILDLVV
jgi:hypothetical protein